MLPHRLRLPFTESQLVRQKGSRTHTFEMELIYSPKPEQGHSRWLIQIPQRLFPKATQRNHLKRLIGEVIRSYLPETKGTGDGVVRVKKGFTLSGAEGFTQETLSEVKTNIERLFQKAGILRA